MRICVLVFVALIISPLGRQNASVTQNHSAHTDNAQKGSKSSKIIINQENAYSPQNQPDQHNTNAAKNQIDYFFWGFVINSVLAIGTAVIAAFAIAQAKATKASVDLIKKKERARLQIELKPMNLGQNEEYKEYTTVVLPANLDSQGLVF